MTAFLRERFTTIAIVKTLGAAALIAFNFYAIVTALGALGIGIGLILGFLLRWRCRRCWVISCRRMWTWRSRLVTSWRACCWVSSCWAFTFIPLYQLGDLRPHFIFRKEAIRLDRPLPYITAAVLILAASRGHGLLAARRVRHHALLRRHGDGAAHLRRLTEE
ncbi:MAG: hypothetical protein R2856_38575 [Caldilineaceae bacterium]